MSQVQVSVITPIYNGEKYLEECIDSILGQTFKELELICVDDGSTDRTNEILIATALWMSAYMFFIKRINMPELPEIQGWIMRRGNMFFSLTQMIFLKKI